MKSVSTFSFSGAIRKEMKNIFVRFAILNETSRSRAGFFFSLNS